MAKYTLASCVVIPSQLSVSSSKIEPFEDHLITHKNFTESSQSKGNTMNYSMTISKICIQALQPVH